jgi:beta-phosphoglucomutase-like phosphatase (HAD superfamily)
MPSTAPRRLRLALPGKTDPAIFLEAASRLGAEAEDCVMVEDAASGLSAGRAGDLGGDIGVDRSANREVLETAARAARDRSARQMVPALPDSLRCNVI